MSAHRPARRRWVLLRQAAGLLSTAAMLGLLWWLWPQNLHGATAYIGVSGHSMDGTYSDGDLIIVKRQPTYDVGDIVVYTIPANELGAGAHVIHRIVGGSAALGYTTQGDNRTLVDPWHPRASDVLGESRMRLPGWGNVMHRLAHPVPLGLLCGGIAMASLLPARESETGSRGRGSVAPRPLVRVDLRPPQLSATTSGPRHDGWLNQPATRGL